MDEWDKIIAERNADIIATILYGNELDCAEACADIRQMGFAAEPAVPALIKLVLDRRDTELNLIVRGLACDALGGIGAAAQEGVPALLECTKDEPGLSDEGRWLRLRAAAAIFKISGNDRIVQQVASELANDSAEWLRSHAACCREMVTGGEPWPRPMEGRVFEWGPSGVGDGAERGAENSG